MKTFWKIILIFCFILGIFLRFYHLEKNLHFADDEGRDALVMLQIVQDKNLPLLGPPSSLGDFSFGPIFYYLIFPFSLVKGPVGMAFGTALLSSASIIFLYFATKRLFDQQTAIFATILYSLAYIPLYYSRWAWNPNLIPFFITLALCCLGLEKRFYLMVASLAIATQLHFSAFLLLPVFIYFSRKIKWPKWLIAGLIFVIIYLPLALAGSNNIKNIITYFRLPKTDPVNYFNAFTKFFEIISASQYLNIIIPLVTVAITLFYFKIITNKKNNSLGSKFLALALPFSILPYFFSRTVLFSHYYAFAYPLIFILVGYVLSLLYQKHFFKIPTAIILLLLIFPNLRAIKNYFSEPEIANYHQIKKTTENVIRDSANRDFNLISLPPKKYDRAYEYFLTINHRQLNPQAKLIYKITNQKDIKIESPEG